MIIGCNSKTQNSVEGDLKPENAISKAKTSGKPFFDFDDIDYYHNDFDENRIGELYDNREKSSLEKLKMDVILNETPNNIRDTNFVEKLRALGYSKIDVAKSKFHEINNIFSEKTYDDFDETACIYVYRDILIFRKKSKITGIAKICFSCDDIRIVGTDSKTEQFGMDGEYEILKTILGKK